MIDPPYALTRAPRGAKPADWQSQIRGFLDRIAYLHASGAALASRGAMDN